MTYIGDSTAASNTYAAPPSASATSPTTSPAACSRPAASDPDYTLRFAPRSYRRWAPSVVATSALGGIAYLADFAIGANIGIAHGTTNALLGILVAAVVIFVTGIPLAYYGLFTDECGVTGVARRR